MENMEALIGQTLGQFTITEKVGEGGMATVFKAYQPSLSRDVALKILPPQFAKQAGFSERFEREAQAIGQLHHPNILPVYDSGQAEGYSYLVMRYIEKASTLADEMKQTLKTERIIEIIGQVAAALDHAHEQGIIHRDIKPSNVLMDGEWPLLSDFGLAKMADSGGVELTGTGVGLGTPAYMSPEQGKGEKVDHRTDIYALGIILFEMLTGIVPHRAETPIATVMKRVNEPLPMPRNLNPSLPEATERVLLKALAPKPADRFDSAGEMATALKESFGTSPEAVLPNVSRDIAAPSDPTTVDQPLTNTQTPSSKFALPVNIAGFAGIGALVLLVLCGIGVLIAFQFWPDRSPITWEYVLDMSSEMNEPFPGESISKWEAAKQTLNEDLALVSEEINVGLRVFGHAEGAASCTESSLLVEPDPGQIALIQDKIDGLSPSGAESPLTEAMVQAFNDLELSPDKRNALIVITDGADTCDPAGVEQVATFMERLNIRIDTYIVGLNVNDPDAEQTLRVLADASDGVFLKADTSNQLKDVLENIQDNLRAERPPKEVAQLPTPIPPTATPVPSTAIPEDTPTPVPALPTPTEVPVATDLTAEEAYALAEAVALAWQDDAILSEMSTTALGFLTPEGKSKSWSVSFWSESSGELNNILVSNGQAQAIQPVALPQAPNIVPFEGATLNAQAIFDTAAAAGGDAVMAEGFKPMASLTKYPLDDNTPTWYVNYSDPESFSVVFTVIIDARSGLVIQALDLR